MRSKSSSGGNAKIQTFPASTRGRQRRNKILLVARKLFLSSGYGDTSIDAIVEKSGGSKATLYSYYPTKEVLFRAVVESIVGWRDDVEIPTDDSVRNALVRFAEVRLGIAFSKEHRMLVRLIIAERERFPDIARLYYEQGPLHSHMVLRDYFEKLIDDKIIDASSADEASDFFRGMLMHHRYVEQLYVDARPLSKEEISVRARHVTDRFLDAYQLRNNSVSIAE